MHASIHRHIDTYTCSHAYAYTCTNATPFITSASTCTSNAGGVGRMPKIVAHTGPRRHGRIRASHTDPLSTCRSVGVSQRNSNKKLMCECLPGPTSHADECCQVAQCMPCLLLRRSCIFIALSSGSSLSSWFPAVNSSTRTRSWSRQDVHAQGPR